MTMGSINSRLRAIEYEMLSPMVYIELIERLHGEVFHWMQMVEKEVTEKILDKYPLEIINSLELPMLASSKEEYVKVSNYFFETDDHCTLKNMLISLDIKLRYLFPKEFLTEVRNSIYDSLIEQPSSQHPTAEEWEIFIEAHKYIWLLFVIQHVNGYKDEFHLESGLFRD